MSTPGDRERVATLDGLRALAFLSVFFNHAVDLHMAWVGVDLFFVLSGFLITGVLLRAKGKPAREFFGHFYSRRARRILPAYLIVLGIVAVIGGGVLWQAVWWYFFTFTQNYASAFQLGVGSLNPMWSLAVEEQFYIVWPLLCFTLPRRALTAVTVAMICAAPLLRAIATPHVGFSTVIFCLTPFRMDLLAAGALLALLWETREPAIRAHRRVAWPILIASAAAFFGPALVFPEWRALANSTVFNAFGYSVSVVMCTVVIVLALTAPSGSVVQRTLSARGFTRLGRISYAAYLIHLPILFFTRPAFNLLGSTVIAYAITIAFAEASWRLVEAPLLGYPRGAPSS